eukprot:9760-Heterococcus_DN1.PRE.1
MALKTFTPQELQIKRFIGELGFMEITDWEYYGGQRSPFDPSMPQRTISRGGSTVRLFEATLPNGERALLKEFPPQAADLASNELAMHKQ